MSLKNLLKIINKNDRTILRDLRFDKMEIIITKRGYSLDKNFFSIKQTHSDKIFFLNKLPVSNFSNFEGDAIVSTIRYPIGVLTADCLPIFIYSEKFDVFAVVHSGWRGTAKKILAKTVKFIKNNLQKKLEELNFILGVSICRDCYEIGEDMYNDFIEKFGIEGDKFFISNRFDLKSANIYLLKELGIGDNHIFSLNKCSVCNNSEYLSYRKENTSKRTFNFFYFH